MTDPVPAIDGRHPAEVVTATVDHVLHLAQRWLSWDGTPIVVPVEGGPPRTYTPHKAVRRVTDQLLDHLADLEARVARQPTEPDAWHGSAATTAADLAAFTEEDLSPGRVADARRDAPLPALVRGLTWRPLSAADLPILAEWLREPQVARWWNHDSSIEGVERDFGASVRGEEPGEDLVVLLDGRPVGLLQRALISDYPEDYEKFSSLVDVPSHAVELDYLIGEAALRGRGLGARLIALAVQDTWTAHPDTAAVLVAVVAGNTASWRALEKAGLKRIAEGPMEPDNPVDDPLHFVYRVDRPTTDSRR